MTRSAPTGTIFTVGGFIGDMPSVPTNETAKQLTALLIGLDRDQRACLVEFARGVIYRKF